MLIYRIIFFSGALRQNVNRRRKNAYCVIPACWNKFGFYWTNLAVSRFKFANLRGYFKKKSPGRTTPFDPSFNQTCADKLYDNEGSYTLNWTRSNFIGYGFCTNKFNCSEESSIFNVLVQMYWHINAY